MPPSTSGQNSSNNTPFTSPRNTLVSHSGIVIAVGDTRSQTPPTNSTVPNTSSALPFDEEAKLVYGVILSLRNMIKRLSGR